MHVIVLILSVAQQSHLEEWYAFNIGIGHLKQKFTCVGAALLLFARQRSLELGYAGRVGLHSLPGAEQFYQRQNMLRYDMVAATAVTAVMRYRSSNFQICEVQRNPVSQRNRVSEVYFINLQSAV